MTYAKFMHNAVRKVVGDELRMWTVLNGPADYPDGYLARCFKAESGQAVPTTLTMKNPDLEKLREELKELGLICFARSEGDDACVVETWV